MISARIRRATPSDVDVIRTLLAELGYPDVSLDVIDTTLNDAANLVLIAELDGNPIALLNLHFRVQLHLGGIVARIDELVVNREYRGRRIGAELVAACLGAARERGAVAVEVTSGESRRHAHAFYERCGFRRASLRFVADLRATPA